MKWGINPSIWQRRFAWKPWKMIDGRWVWLEWVEVTGYVQNPDVTEKHAFNCRIASTSFAVRPITTQEPTR